MKIDIVVPTYNRPEKLKRCLDSIIKQSYKDWECLVVINGNDDETPKMLDKIKDSRIWYKTRGWNSYVIGAWNYYFEKFFTKRNKDAIMWIVDDVELKENCLENAIITMKGAFPDTDGVVGLHQECPDHPEYTFKWYGQVLLGKKFIERYKDVNYKVCCEAYRHFYQDEEMHMFASSLGRFWNCEEAQLIHYHPSFIKTNIDEAHNKVRFDIKKNDLKVYTERRKKGLVWGKTWEI